jgi:hypothetical protein
MFKDADYLTGFSEEFASVASREITNRAVLRNGCCWCCSRSAPTWACGGWWPPAPTSTARPRRSCGGVRRLYVNRDNLRRAITRLVTGTFAVRDTGLWGAGTACASDSTEFSESG